MYFSPTISEQPSVRSDRTLVDLRGHKLTGVQSPVILQGVKTLRAWVETTEE